MEVEFWHQRWADNDIGFHENKFNSLLVQYFSQLSLLAGQRVFVPLCGKTRDIQWLISQGYQVVGAELSEAAITQLFVELGVTPRIVESGPFKQYSHHNIDIFVGDIFKLSAALIGTIDGVYDRAALVALPADMRVSYTQHLRAITANAPQLLICFNYDQALMKGPPFSITDDEVTMHYQANYQLHKVACVEVVGGLKGRCAATENGWLLT